MFALGNAAKIASRIICKSAGLGILHDQAQLRIELQPLGLTTQNRLVNFIPALDRKSYAPAASLHTHREMIDALLELERENKVVGGNVRKLISESGGIEQLLAIEIPGHPPVGSRADEHLAFFGGFNAGESPHHFF